MKSDGEFRKQTYSRTMMLLSPREYYDTRVYGGEALLAHFSNFNRIYSPRDPSISTHPRSLRDSSLGIGLRRERERENFSYFL